MSTEVCRLDEGGGGGGSEQLDDVSSVIKEGVKGKESECA